MRKQVKGTEGRQEDEPPDYILVRGDWIPTPEKIEDDNLKASWKRLRSEVLEEEKVEK